jgi:dihydrofolate reductase
MRRIIAALQTSLDGFIEGPNGELDWVQSWEDPFDLLPQIDACILGAGMYPGYEQYWRAILANPTAPAPFSNSPPTPGEVEYAKFADRTPHYVVSKTMKNPTWANTRIVRGLDELRSLKTQPGKDIHAVGGATLVSSLVNAGLVDELRIVVQPILLGGGKPLFKDVTERHELHFDGPESIGGGLARLTYRVGAG